MSEFNWTEDQKRAINSRGKNILVSAAAGSGKTTILTERLKRLVLEHGVNCHNLLVLTFTRAAASEMKQRFKKKLFDSIAQKEVGKLSEKDIIFQINALTDSQISTIHSFAQTMIRRHFEVLGIDPGFRIADDNEMDLLTENTMNEVFEELFLKNETEPDDDSRNFIELAELFGGQLAIENLKSSLRNLNRFYATLAYPEIWVDEVTRRMDAVTDDNVFELESYEILEKSLRETIQSISEKFALIGKHYEEIPWGKSKSKAGLEEEIIAAERISLASNLKSLILQIKAFPAVRVVFPRKKNMSEKELDAIEYIKSLRGDSTGGARFELRKLVKQFENIDINEEVPTVHELSRVFKNLNRLLILVNEALDRKKKQQKILTFSDLERLLLKLLDNPEVRKSIQNQFQFVYLDEVQDTNEIQDTIIKKIENGYNRFMVGDIKQSIYRFRSADPTIMIAKYFAYKAADNSELILLNENFRSSPEIINGINAVFEKIMSTQIGEVEYDDEARLIATRTDHTKKPEIDLIIKDSEEYIDKDELQAKFIANKIHELVQSGQAEYKDIGILYRSIKAKAPTILKILSEEGIPVYYDGGDTQVDTIEIDIFFQLISLIDNNKQDIALASIMELPGFGFTSDDLAKIRVTYPDEVYFFQAVESYRDNQKDELAARLKDFYFKLKTWREWSKHKEIDGYLWDLLLESGLYDYFGNQPGGSDRKVNLRIFIDKAIEYANSNLKDITSFIQYVNQLKKNGKSLITTGTQVDSENFVRLLTIHKSKGLEFKIVFYSGLGTQFNLSRDDNFIYSKKFGFSSLLPAYEDQFLTLKDSLLNASFRELNKREMLSEEMRLIYVAMTRARDQLYIVANIDDFRKKESEYWNKPANSSTIQKMRTPIDWVMCAVYKDEGFEKKDSSIKTDNWQVNLIDSIEKADAVASQEEEIIEQEDYLKLKEQIYNQLSKSQKEIKNTKPVKMSVSRIEQHSIREEEPVKLISLENKEPVYTGQDIGTATHTIMQRLDINKILSSTELDKAVESEIERITDSGFIDAGLKEKISIENITHFFTSDTGKRYLNSYRNNPDNIIKEYPFLFDTNMNNELDVGVDRPIELSGILDVSFLEDNAWVIIDYKTDRLYSEEEFKQRLGEYSTQVNLYSQALENLTKIPVKEKHLYFLSENEDVLVR